MNTNNTIKEKLLSHSIKPSLQRMAVMKYLSEHRTHPTVDVIFNDLSPLIPTLSKTTVYNTLKLLSDQGAILSLNIDEKNVRYDGETTTHAHFRCKKCNKIFDVMEETMNTTTQDYIQESKDFQITECHVYYKGYCKDCEKKLN
ncbi:MAG: transcriptional repressor [Candidatus Azobacteroides sp.]|nr:transcriptional repressor [Candidatus Azobacteroides sp.]